MGNLFLLTSKEKVLVYSWLYNILTLQLALVWLINGLFCKILNGLPRHQEIVAAILGEAYAYWLTKAIGIAEVFMAVWILMRVWPRLNAVLQIVVVLAMNVIEVLAVPELLLWGPFNLLFALLFSVLIYWYEFVLRPRVR